jgi:hypothetical protein
MGLAPESGFSVCLWCVPDNLVFEDITQAFAICYENYFNPLSNGDIQAEEGPKQRSEKSVCGVALDIDDDTTLEQAIGSSGVLPCNDNNHSGHTNANTTYRIFCPNGSSLENVNSYRSVTVRRMILSIPESLTLVCSVCRHQKLGKLITLCYPHKLHYRSLSDYIRKEERGRVGSVGNDDLTAGYFCGVEVDTNASKFLKSYLPCTGTEVKYLYQKSSIFSGLSVEIGGFTNAVNPGPL